MTQADPYASIAERIAPGAKVVCRWPLTGGVSAQVEGVELALRGGARRRVVVRRHREAAWKKAAPDVTATHFRLLTMLAAAKMRVPEPLLLELSNDPLGSPFFVMDFVEGASDIDPTALTDALRAMAEYLAELHAHTPDVTWLPVGEDPTASALAYLPASDPLSDVLRERTPLAPVNAAALLHGDFWPGNVLWKDGRIAAVIDWEDAAVGDPLSDLACCRLELLWRYGADAAETFTGHYLARARIDQGHLPYWEIYAASAAAACMGEWGLDPTREAEMRRKAAKVVDEARTLILGVSLSTR